MIVPGMVTNITRFGAFIDIGVKQDGLVHVSEIAHRFISDPNEVLKLNDKVLVKVTEVDVQRKRIALSIKQAQSESRPQHKSKILSKPNALSEPRTEGVRLKAFGEKNKSPNDSMEDALSALKKKFSN
jgi:uncharacterized protein